MDSVIAAGLIANEQINKSLLWPKSEVIPGNCNPHDYNAANRTFGNPPRTVQDVPWNGSKSKSSCFLWGVPTWCDQTNYTKLEQFRLGDSDGPNR